jgi:hypothetical protein
MSLQTFKDMNNIVRTYEIELIAQSFSPKRELALEIKDEELKRLFAEFLNIIQEFLRKGDYLATAQGTADWLDLVYRYLEVLENMIKIVGEKNYPKYEADTRSIIEFSVDSMINLIQRGEQYVNKQKGLLRKTRTVSPNLKPSILLVLAELAYSLFSIIFTIIRVEAKEAIPQELYSVVGEALHRTKRLC